MKNNTHLIQDYPSKKHSVLSRAVDGMVLAYRNDTKVAFGENPKALEFRDFIDSTYAMKALRKIADEDWFHFQRSKDANLTADEVAARIEEVDAESRIVRVQ